MKTYLFPGQGSQKIGMGKGLFEQYPELTQTADDILGYSIASLCLLDKDKQLNKTQFTQPALYVVGALSYQHQVALDDCPADFLAGHSLGEYNALHASGALSFEDGLELVKKRGELMSLAAEGAMAAVLGLNEATLHDCLSSNKWDAIDIANLNSRSQIVISGLVDDIINCQAAIEKAGGRFIRLNTSGAFHSRYMAPAKQQFADYINGFQLTDIQTPVIANVTALPYQSSQIKDQLIEQITQPVRWAQSIEYLLNQGEMQFKELGSGKVLSNLVRQITKDVHNMGSDTPIITTAPTPQINLNAATRKKNIRETQQQIRRWNQQYPVGSTVRVVKYGEPLATRTEAMLLFGHRAAIYLQGYNGYFTLDEVNPA